MTRNSQLSLYIILGLIIIIILGFSGFVLANNYKKNINLEQTKSFSKSPIKTNMENIINSCIEYAVKEEISTTGIRNENLEQYSELVKANIISCTSPILSNFEKEGYEIKKGKISINIDLNTETIDVNVNYPLTIFKDSTIIDFSNFNFCLDRSNSIHIPNGITTKEIRLISTNGKAELKIPKDVKITDEFGNSVEQIGIKIKDLHFDNLNNGVVVGELVYENFPDGVQFSQPIEMTIEFNENDIPKGYTTDNLRVSYWDENDGIWYAPPTSIKENLATSNITHFSTWSITYVKPILIYNVLFKERFKPTSGGPEGTNTGVWSIGGKEGNIKDSVTLQPGFSSIFDVMDSYGDNFNDFREERKITETDSINKLEYGYFIEDKFINCEKYTSDNIGNINYYLKQSSIDSIYYPYFINDFEEEEFGWHNYQCAGGKIRPKDDTEGKFSEYVEFKPSGDAAISILGMEIKRLTPIFLPYTYPIENTISIDYSNEYYETNEDFTYPFYCEFEPFSDDEIFKKIEQDSLNSHLVYGFYGFNIIKKTDHPLTQSEMHTQCELFIFMLGNGVVSSETIAQENAYETLELNPRSGLIAEIIGYWTLRNNFIGHAVKKVFDSI